MNLQACERSIELRRRALKAALNCHKSPCCVPQAAAPLRIEQQLARESRKCLRIAARRKEARVFMQNNVGDASVSA
jgi:hypothetical protein